MERTGDSEKVISRDRKSWRSDIGAYLRYDAEGLKTYEQELLEQLAQLLNCYSRGRGVLVDFTRNLDTVVDRDLLEKVIAAQDIELRKSDILMLRTGYAEARWDMQEDPTPDRLGRTGAVLDGTDMKLCEWITESRIAAVAAENYAVEHPHSYPRLSARSVTATKGSAYGTAVCAMRLA